ncbi:ABC transporter substrate-binding protein [Herbaspirillum sp. RV1423]|uniref:ABC transporter substrate-binding protein n=1 Tax=Herbaspirillum sp. RV1423 TaxID=1443993 RepID=UPI0004B5FBDF|nr:ABC transporter substrate-binding protein [Herbaspirillum sp. RV1423]
MDIKKRKFGMQSLLIAACILAAQVPAFAQTAEKPQSGGTLNMLMQPEPPTLMLGLNQQGPTQFAASKIYQSLLTYGPDLKPLPSLAQSWEVSKDGLTYTFVLQKGVKWHDGKPFSAADVVFSADKFLREVHPRMRALMNQRVESVKADGDNKVVFKLKQAFNPFIYAFEVSTMPIVPKHIYDGTDYRTNPANNTPIGTGPFMFKEWKRGSYIHLVKNPAYFKPGLPYLDDIYLRVVPDAASRAVAFERGTVDVLRGGDVENFEVRRLQKLPNTVMTTAGWEMFSPNVWLQMNLRKPPFDNKVVRQAIMHAMDRNFIVKNIFFNVGKPATGPISSTTLYYDKNVPAYPYDMAKAKKMLADAGIKPGDYSIKVLPIPYGSVWDRLAEYTKQQLEQLGFRVAIDPTDAGGWSKKLSDWDFDVTINFLYQYGDPAIGVARNYVSSNIIKGTPFGNNQGYSNPEVDRLFEAAPVAKNPDARQRMYSEVQRILVDDVAVGYLMELQYATLYNKKVHNLVTTGIGLNETLDSVWISK